MIVPRRLVVALLWEVRLQYRQGFYWAAAFVVLVWLGLLGTLDVRRTEWLLPVVVFSNVVTNAFYFLGGLVLLEKREGTLEALVVTPLRGGEYLAVKVLTLTLLSLAENLTIVAFVAGPGVRWAVLAAAIVVAAALLALAGFLVVVRYDSINEYLLPSLLYTALLSLPLIPYFGVGRSPLFLLHPLQPALDLLRAAFEPAASWTAAYGLAGGAAWIAVGAALASRAFFRFVVSREGARA